MSRKLSPLTKTRCSSLPARNQHKHCREMLFTDAQVRVIATWLSNVPRKNVQEKHGALTIVTVETNIRPSSEKERGEHRNRPGVDVRRSTFGIRKTSTAL